MVMLAAATATAAAAVVVVVLVVVEVVVTLVVVVLIRGGTTGVGINEVLGKRADLAATGVTCRDDQCGDSARENFEMIFSHRRNDEMKREEGG